VGRSPTSVPEVREARYPPRYPTLRVHETFIGSLQDLDRFVIKLFYKLSENPEDGVPRPPILGSTHDLTKL
jgi:hypothetical protein